MKTNNNLGFKVTKIRNSLFHKIIIFIKSKPLSVVFGIMVIGLLLNSGFLSKYSHLFKASLLDIQKVEFTGTINPIEKVPNWVELTDGERLMTFDQIPKSKFINLPEYKISDFQNGKEWSPTNGDQRNAYITYPVPNLGNYRLDGTENSGSHPGVDIKAPIGTPIRAIANGVIHKTDNQVTGFGKFVSIMHTNVQDPKDSSKEITLYSNYAHMSVVFVKDGQTVEKGQVIGKVGNTGMATTPHLHFQLDTDDAPFHPYWPFSWADVQKAGLNSYFEAVKRGIGKNNAEQYTIHPIQFVVNYENYHPTKNLVVSSDPKIVVEVTEVEPVVDVKIKEIENEVDTMKKVAPIEKKKEIEVIVEKKEEKEPVKIVQKGTMNFKTNKSFVPGEEQYVDVYIDKDFLVATAGIEISSTLKSRAQVEPQKLYQKDFNNGVAKVIVKTDSPYAFKMIAKGDFGTVKSKSIRPEVFKDVSSNYIYSVAIKDLKDKKVIKGYSDGTFKPKDTLNRAEALKMILVSNSVPITEQSVKFSDVSSRSWYWKYVGVAVGRGIVKGYEDVTFRPGNIVTRAEFIKMAILSTGKTVQENISEKSYPDVKTTAWYATYFQFAKKYELLRIKDGGSILPNAPITRGEAADVIYRLSRLK